MSGDEPVNNEIKAPDCYDMDSQRITFDEWVELFRGGGREIATDTLSLPSGVLMVTTTWIGLDHRFGGGVPLIFETVVITEIGEVVPLRYTTREAAEIGHAEFVQKLRGADDLRPVLFGGGS